MVFEDVLLLKNSCMRFSGFAGKRVLLLQGPVGPFFWNLSKDLQKRGADVFKFNFNAGDALFYPLKARSFKGDLAQWPKLLEAFMKEHQIDVVLLFGDCRPVHLCVREIAQKLNCALGVFEEGYLRPDYVTFEPVGVNGNSEFAQSLAPWLVQEAMRSQPHSPQQGSAAPTTLPVGNTFWHSAMWGMAYFFAAWLGQWCWNNALHHRRMTVLDAPWWWLSFARKAWYKIKEYGVERTLCEDRRRQFFLVPLQVYNDAQITVHSDFESVCSFADYVMRSFKKAWDQEQAEGVPEGGQSLKGVTLVFKHHPMDRGHRNYGRALRVLTQRYGLQGRVQYIHDQHLPSLLKATRGVVVVNSTVGLSALGHRAPVKVCGTALYDMPGLTYQGKLRTFWHLGHQAIPCQDELQRFRHALIRRTQLNGSFYRKLQTVQWACGVALDGQMAERLWPEAMSQAHTTLSRKPTQALLRNAAANDQGLGNSDVFERDDDEDVKMQSGSVVTLRKKKV